MPADEIRSALRFSTVVVARDEARALPLLLGDLEPFLARGGEVLVLDTGSSDATVAIARDRGCRVEVATRRFDTSLEPAAAAAIERRFARGDEGPLVQPGQRLFHFAAARQHASSLASNRFVFQVDASDRLQAFDVDALDARIGEGASILEYEQAYLTLELRIARFYDRDRYEWQGRVHEVLSSTAPQEARPSPVRCPPAQLRIRHVKDEDKPRNYLAGLALQVLETPEKPRWWHYLGRELYYRSFHRAAVEVLEAHAAMETAWSAERSQSLCFAGECLEALDRVEEAKDAYRRAAVFDGTRREPFLRLATLLSRSGEFEATVELARRALSIPHTCGYPELAANYTWVPHSLLYWSLFWLGKREEAREHWKLCATIAPEESRAHHFARLFPLIV